MLYRFYIGLNDKDEHIQVISNRNVERILGHMFDSCTYTFGKGYFRGGAEPCVIVEIVDTPENESKIIYRIETIKRMLNQECILMIKLDSLKEELI